ncbi:cytochrome P450 [Mycobacterium conspicuum]|jgi:cytochrome P450|uniref:Cytochrome P450 n=1 Tax=Mycobacterium conspicuum TaxID=44010 RepID=A0A1X1TH91_9MYCO|nr:cytochrome P450 [Mycobacterium conspicuum]ORV43911.1 cytochrome [Mycobacterium conspicuum]BBZ38158.1 cytochrome P450 [Mycobacterium conspicuum]
MKDFGEVNFFSDADLAADPYPYYEYLRAQCPVLHVPSSGVVAVTGYDELVQVYRDSATFSAVNSSLGPFPLPFEANDDDITEQLDAHRDEFPMSEHLVSFDPPKHTAHRALLNGLFTPKRLKENEEFMWRLADQLIDEFIADGRAEFASAYGQPFPLLVIADLLGVPEADHAMFRRLLAGQAPAEDQRWVENMNPLAYLDKWFTAYISERRESPAHDVLTEIATQRFADGSLPEVVDLVRIATFLFVAGHETTARLLSSSLRVLAEDPDLQNTLRANRDRIPNFVEEMLRFESPIKSDFRLTRVATTLGGVELAAGTTVMLLPGAANRDPRHFDCPAELRADRPNARQNVAFARGAHSCPGGPLARIEGRVTIERILDRLNDIRLDESYHGPPGDRRFDYVPLYILRGLQALHIEFNPGT